MVKIGQSQVKQVFQTAATAVKSTVTKFEVVKSPLQTLKQDVVEIAGVQKTKSAQTAKKIPSISENLLSFADKQLTQTLT